MQKTTKQKISEAIFEIIVETKYEKEARKYLKKLLKNKNISLDYFKKEIEIQDSEGIKVLHTIKII